LRLEKVADLDVAAASGVIDVGGELWIIADDELELAVYTRAGRPLRRVPLVEAAPLPDEHEARKRRKPDLEALALLPDGSVVALGSGSKPNRRRGARVRGGRVRPVDVGPLYERLLGELPELNVEGAAACGPVLRLFSRGNGPSGVNAVIDVALAPILEDGDDRPWGPGLLVDVTPIALPPGLGFTDATPAGGDRVLFAAADEASGDTYADGPVAGSSVGLVEGVTLRWIVPVGPMKIEGITRAGDALALVTDADDRRAPAGLYSADWPLSL
jgi:hypothetical protein